MFLPHEVQVLKCRHCDFHWNQTRLRVRFLPPRYGAFIRRHTVWSFSNVQIWECHFSTESLRRQSAHNVNACTVYSYKHCRQNVSLFCQDSVPEWYQAAGDDNVHVGPRFHHTGIGWNLSLTRKACTSEAGIKSWIDPRVNSSLSNTHWHMCTTHVKVL